MRNELKKIWFRAKEKISEWRSDDPMMIAPYLSYANEEEIIIRGRVLEDEGIVVQEDDGKWRNLVNSIKRMESDEAKHVQIIAHFNGTEYSSKTNDEGFFKIIIPTKTKPSTGNELEWITPMLRLPAFLDENNNPIQCEVQILCPHAQTQYAIISDMDDTILESHVNSFLKLRLLYETFLKNVHSRLAFENIGNALQTLSQNEEGNQVNPIFYISHSPWNLYELLIQFLEKNEIPKGPFFLRDFGYKRGQEKFEYENHKALAIEHLMNFYPNLNFVLLGDATEHDVDIYTEAYNKFPGRVLKIIIRATEDDKNQHVTDVQSKNPDVPINLIAHSDEIVGLFKV